MKNKISSADSPPRDFYSGKYEAFDKCDRQSRERNPRPEEIADRAAAVRATWSPAIRARRREFITDVTWLPPVFAGRSRGRRKEMSVLDAYESE